MGLYKKLLLCLIEMKIYTSKIDKFKTCPAAKGWGGCNRRNSCHKTDTKQEK